MRTAPNAGFTFSELIVVMGIMLVIIGLATINLLGIQRKPSLASILVLLVTDLRAQQVKAMTGESGSGTTASSHGVYFANNYYVIFRGASYDQNNSGNFTVKLPANIQISQVTLPGKSAIFIPGSGELSAYEMSRNSLTITEIGSGETKTVEINPYGVVN